MWRLPNTREMLSGASVQAMMRRSGKLVQYRIMVNMQRDFRLILGGILCLCLPLRRAPLDPFSELRAFGPGERIGYSHEHRYGSPGMFRVYHSFEFKVVSRDLMQVMRKYADGPDWEWALPLRLPDGRRGFYDFYARTATFYELKKWRG